MLTNSMVSFQRKITSRSINHRCSQFQILRLLRFLLSEDKLRYPRRFVCDIEQKPTVFFMAELKFNSSTLVMYIPSEETYYKALAALASSAILNFYGLF